jgi:hypothetical protein
VGAYPDILRQGERIRAHDIVDEYGRRAFDGLALTPQEELAYHHFLQQITSDVTRGRWTADQAIALVNELVQARLIALSSPNPPRPPEENPCP